MINLQCIAWKSALLGPALVLAETAAEGFLGSAVQVQGSCGGQQGKA